MEPSNWPSFEHDRWAKVRLIWTVTWAFKNGLKIKKEREERMKKLSRRSKKNNSIQKRSSTLKPKPQLQKSKQISENVIKQKENNIVTVQYENDNEKSLHFEDKSREKSSNEQENINLINTNRQSSIYNDKSLAKSQSSEKTSTKITENLFKFESQISKLISLSGKNGIQNDILSKFKIHKIHFIFEI